MRPATATEFPATDDPFVIWKGFRIRHEATRYDGEVWVIESSDGDNVAQVDKAKTLEDAKRKADAHSKGFATFKPVPVIQVHRDRYGEGAVTFREGRVTRAWGHAGRMHVNVSWQLPTKSVDRDMSLERNEKAIDAYKADTPENRARLSQAVALLEKADDLKREALAIVNKATPPAIQPAKVEA